jgi:hypothetical protein
LSKAAFENQLPLQISPPLIVVFKAPILGPFSFAENMFLIQIFEREMLNARSWKVVPTSVDIQKMDIKIREARKGDRVTHVCLNFEGCFFHEGE